jgi:integrase
MRAGLIDVQAAITEVASVASVASVDPADGGLKLFSSDRAGFERPNEGLIGGAFGEEVGSTKDHAPLVLLLAYTGLRWGEATGLRVRDVDTLKRRLTVRENAVRVNGKIVVGTPKSHASRTVPYPDFLTLDLARQCQGKASGDLVFGAGLVRLVAPTHGGWFEYAIKRAQTVDRTFPRLTPHDLRHTAASLAISAGANVKAVQRMLGHASEAMTLDVYADLFDDDLDAVAVALNQARIISSVAKVWPNEAAGPSPVAALLYK